MILEKASKFSVDALTEDLKYFISKEDYSLIEKNYENEKKKQMRTLNELREEVSRGVYFLQLKNAKSDCNKYALLAISKVSKDVQEAIYERLGGKPIDPVELQNRLSLKADK